MTTATRMNATVTRATVSAHLWARRAARRFWEDEEGVAVSTVLLIATLVVAVGIFAGIVWTQVQDAGTCVQGVDFTGGTTSAC